MRDVLAYATAVGFGASAAEYEADLPWVWEAEPTFAVVPTWVTTFSFWGRRQQSDDKISTASTTNQLPSFPPPSMAETGLKAKTRIPLELFGERPSKQATRQFTFYPSDLARLFDAGWQQSTSREIDDTSYAFQLLCYLLKLIVQGAICDSLLTEAITVTPLQPKQTQNK